MLSLNRVPDLATLEIFVEVAQSSSISKAARNLGLSQQAVSARMRSLEGTTRLSLLQRTTTGATLSPDGLALLTQVERVLAAAQDLQQHIETTSGDRAKTLEVAASQTVAEHLVPHWLIQFQTEVRQLGQKTSDVSVHVGNTQDVIKFLRNQVVELGFIESPHIPAEFNHKIIAHDQLELVVCPQHPWAKQDGPLSLERLTGTSLVMRELGSGTRDVLEFELARYGRVNVPAALELGTTSAVRSAAVAGIAPSFLSLRTVQGDLDSGRLVTVSTELGKVTRPFTALWNGPTHRLSPQAQALLKITQLASNFPH